MESSLAGVRCVIGGVASATEGANGATTANGAEARVIAMASRSRAADLRRRLVTFLNRISEAAVVSMLGVIAASGRDSRQPIKNYFHAWR